MRITVRKKPTLSRCYGRMILPWHVCKISTLESEINDFISTIIITLVFHGGQNQAWASPILVVIMEERRAYIMGTR